MPNWGWLRINFYRKEIKALSKMVDFLRRAAILSDWVNVLPMVG
jgi:hypothetical protein